MKDIHQTIKLQDTYARINIDPTLNQKRYQCRPPFKDINYGFTLQPTNSEPNSCSFVAETASVNTVNSSKVAAATKGSHF